MFNRYSYALNDPINNIDPDGRCVWDLCIAESVLVYVAVAALITTAVYVGDDVVEAATGTSDGTILGDTVIDSAAEGIASFGESIADTMESRSIPVSGDKVEEADKNSVFAKKNKQERNRNKNPQQKQKPQHGNNNKKGNNPNSEEKAVGKRKSSFTKDKPTPPKPKVPK